MKRRYLSGVYLFFTLCLISSCAECSSSGRRRLAQEKNQNTVLKPTEDTRNRAGNTPLRPVETAPQPALSANPTRSDIVAYAEPCVFLVYSLVDNQVVGQGTGFFINEDIGVSNHHVFAAGTEWAIETTDKQRYRVSEVVKSSADYDHVVFRVETEGRKMPFLKLAKTTPRKGEEIMVLGNPKGLESTVTRGIVSAIRPQNNADDLLQIDAAISPGSSGSPVLNMHGEVVGIATKKVLDCENCNFAYNIRLILQKTPLSK